MKFLRWQGALAFAVIFGGIALLFYLFAELLVKTGLEKGIAYYTKAEVNINDVELAYSPLSITVKGLQATDAKSPSYNVVAFKEASADIDFWQYIFGKVIIENLIIEDLTFSSPRENVGEVYQQVDTPEVKKSSDGFDFKVERPDLPDPSMVLANSNLLTVKAGQALTTAYKQETNKLANIQSQLPDQQSLKAYQSKLTALSDRKVKSLDDIEQIKQEFEQLKAQVKQDKQLVKKAKEQVSQVKDVLSEKIADLKAAPAQDWQNVKQNYQLSSIDGGDLAQLLFGDKAREYYEQGAQVYKLLAPVFAKQETTEQQQKKATEGRFIFFQQEQALPAFWIKNMRFSLLSSGGSFSFKAQDLTHQHWLLNKVTQYQLSSDNVNKLGKLRLTGELSLDQTQHFKTLGKWQLTDMPLRDARIVSNDKISLTLTSGALQAKGQYQVKDSDLESHNHIIVNKTAYRGEGSNRLADLLIETLQATPSLDLDIGVLGDINKPNFSLSSSLDNVLKNALKSKVDDKLTAFQNDFQAGLNDKVTSALKLNSSEKGELLNIEALVNDSDQALEKLLQSDIVKQKEQELKDKAKNKLKDKMKSLF